MFNIISSLLSPLISLLIVYLQFLAWGVVAPHFNLPLLNFWHFTLLWSLLFPRRILRPIVNGLNTLKKELEG